MCHNWAKLEKSSTEMGFSFDGKLQVNVCVLVYYSVSQ